MTRRRTTTELAAPPVSTVDPVDGPSPVDVKVLALQLAALTHPWRLSLVCLLAQRPVASYTVTDMLELVGADIPRPSATEHLHVLTQAGWVERRYRDREGSGGRILSFTPVSGMLSGVVAGLTQLGGVGGKPKRRKT